MLETTTKHQIMFVPTVTVCPKSLVQFPHHTHYVKMDKTPWINSAFYPQSYLEDTVFGQVLPRLYVHIHDYILVIVLPQLHSHLLHLR